MKDKDILCELYMDTFSDVSYDGDSDIPTINFCKQS